MAHCANTPHRPAWGQRKAIPVSVRQTPVEFHIFRRNILVWLSWRIRTGGQRSSHQANPIVLAAWRSVIILVIFLSSCFSPPSEQKVGLMDLILVLHHYSLKEPTSPLLASIHPSFDGDNMPAMPWILGGWDPPPHQRSWSARRSHKPARRHSSCRQHLSVPGVCINFKFSTEPTHGKASWCDARCNSSTLVVTKVKTLSVLIFCYLVLMDSSLMWTWQTCKKRKKYQAS